MEHATAALRHPHYHIPLQELDAKDFLEKNGADNAVSVYVLCGSGSGKRAAMAAEAIIAAGHERVHVIEGGVVACQASGIDIIKGEFLSLERQVRIAAGILVVTGVAVGALVATGFYALSGAVGGGLVFAGVTDSCGLAFALAKAPWNKRYDRNSHVL